MNNKKKLTVIIAVLFVVCVFAVLVFSGVISFDKTGREEDTTEDNGYHQSEEELEGIIKGDTTDAPYLETNIDGLFYTMTTDGKVSFYKFENNAFAPVEATGTYTAAVTLSEEKITADITYYSDEGKIAGYGLYTGENGQYNLYPYALFRLTNYGSEYEYSSTKSCLLLIDTTEDDFYSNNKIYEESFIFNYSDSSTSRTLTEESRTIGINGAKRQDYFMFNDSVINGSTNHHLFFSGRQYAEDDERVDLYRSGGSGNNTDNIRVGIDVLGYHVFPTENGVLYVSVDENGNVVLKRYYASNDNTETVKTFDGIQRDDIIISDNYIYIISKNAIYSVIDDTETECGDGTSSFRADMFSANGDWFIVRGYIDSYKAAFSLNTSADGETFKAYTRDLFRNLVNPIITDDGTVIFTIEDSGKFTYYIFYTPTLT